MTENELKDNTLKQTKHQNSNSFLPKAPESPSFK